MAETVSPENQASPRAFRSAVKASSVSNLMKGSIDVHAHFGPDSRTERSVDVTELLGMAQDLEMRALVLNSAEYPTYVFEHVCRKIAPRIEAIGGVCLEVENGGLNPEAVRTAGRSGARVVWMPTNSAANDCAVSGREGEGISLLDGAGKLQGPVDDILSAIKQHDMVLATGHISADETIAVVARAKKIGVRRIMVSHPMTSRVGARLSLEQTKLLAAQGCYIEHTFHAIMPRRYYLTVDQLLDIVKAVGPGRSILSTDLGQIYNPPPPIGMRMMIATFLSGGFSDEEVELMTRTNPARMLGIA